MSWATINDPQSKEFVYPNLFRVAMDILPMQATSVMSERVFSATSKIVSKERNRLSPKKVEILQILKFHLRRKHISFISDPAWIQSTHDQLMENIVPEIDGLLEQHQHQQAFDILSAL